MSFDFAVQLNIRTWQTLLREDPELTRIEIGIAHCARIQVTEDYSSPQCAEAIAQDRRLRDQRYALWQLRAQAQFDEDAP